MLQGVRRDVDSCSGARGRNKKRLRLDAWAFARISLRLTDEEYAKYTEGEIAALVRARQECRQYEYALSVSTALAARWGTADNPLPFAPKNFMPMSEEEQAKREVAQEKLRIAQQRFLSTKLQSMVEELNKKSDAS